MPATGSKVRLGTVKPFSHKKITKQRKTHSKSKKKIKSNEEALNEINKLKGKEYCCVYTDGGCYNNGKPGAKGGIGVWFDDEELRNNNHSSPLLGSQQTNQRAELSATIKALELVPIHKTNICIITDSSYLVNCMTKWYVGTSTFDSVQFCRKYSFSWTS